MLGCHNLAREAEDEVIHRLEEDMCFAVQVRMFMLDIQDMPQRVDAGSGRREAGVANPRDEFVHAVSLEGGEA